MTQPHWTHRYFGRLYGEIYSRHLLPAARTRREAAFVREILGPVEGPVLDLAAGFGRHAKALERHYRMVALDLNPRYLAISAAAPRKSRRPFAPVAGDMRDLPFAPGAFGAVTLLFNSFGYFGHDTASTAQATRRLAYRLPKVFYERKLVPANFGETTKPEPAPEAVEGVAGSDENSVVLEEIARVLRPGGTLLVELANPAAVIEAITEQPRLSYSVGKYSVAEEFSYAPETRRLTNSTRFSDGELTEVSEYQIRLYDRAEMAAALRAAGLRPVAVYGDYDGTKFDRRHSECMLFEAQRLTGRRRK